VAQTLILDSEAINALARPKERGALAERARAILTVAHDRRALVRVPAPVLAEVCRGPRFDAAIDRILNGRGVLVCELTRQIAQRAGTLLTKAKLDSRCAVDAFVVATALEFSSSIIATADADDVRRLAAGQSSVTIYSL
jgi:predicted nucleic acid-binding protein